MQIRQTHQSGLHLAPSICLCEPLGPFPLAASKPPACEVSHPLRTQCTASEPVSFAAAPAPVLLYSNHNRFELRRVSRRSEDGGRGSGLNTEPLLLALCPAIVLVDREPGPCLDGENLSSQRPPRPPPSRRPTVVAGAAIRPGLRPATARCRSARLFWMSNRRLSTDTASCRRPASCISHANSSVLIWRHRLPYETGLLCSPESCQTCLAL